MSRSKSQARERRHRRVRKKISGTAERPRLAVFRSNRHISVQAVDDGSGRTLAAASTHESSLASGKPLESAEAVGKAIAERLGALNIEVAVFDRGGFHYHGRVAAVAEGARTAGLKV